MIKLSMQSNVREIGASISALAEGIQNTATLRAINRAVDAVSTEANKEVRKVYRIRAQVVRRAITKRRAYRGQAVMSGAVVFRGKRLNLADFNARQTAKGVSVQVLVDGPRKVIPGVFMATNTSTGFRGVFRRVGKSRYPIKNLKSISIPQAIGNKVIDACPYFFTKSGEVVHKR
jgi:hypothetical protein